MQNVIGGSYKFVLIVDHFGHENVSEKLIQTLIGPNQQLYNLESNFTTTFKTNLLNDTQKLDDVPHDSSILIPVSTLCHLFTLPAIFTQIHKFKKIINKQIFGWVSVGHLEHNFIVPFLEHMANAVITLKCERNLSILLKKSGGSISKKLYRYKIQNKELILNEIQAEEAIKKTDENEVNPESLATFKINADEEEMIARNALKLPYERNNPTVQNECQIIYQPDADDDFDEEDPDEDLYI